MLYLTHRRFARSVSPYADGELDGPAAQRLAHHLDECEDCNHDLAMVHAIKGSLHRLAATEPPTLAATRLRRWAANLPEVSGFASRPGFASPGRETEISQRSRGGPGRGRGS